MFRELVVIVLGIIGPMQDFDPYGIGEDAHGSIGQLKRIVKRSAQIP